MRQQSPKPTRKVIATTIGGAVAVVVLYLLQAYVLPDPLPTDVYAALATIISAAVAFAVGYLVPPGEGDGIE